MSDDTCFDAYADEEDDDDVYMTETEAETEQEEEEDPPAPADPGEVLLANVYKKLGHGIGSVPQSTKAPARVVIRDAATLHKLEQFTDRHMRLQHEMFARDFLLFMLYASDGDLLYRYRELDHVLRILLAQPEAAAMSAAEIEELTTMLRPQNCPDAGWDETRQAPQPPCQWKKHEEDAMLLFAISTVPAVQKWFFDGPPVFDVASVEQFFFRGGMHGAYEPVRDQWAKCLRGVYGNQGFVRVVQYVYANYAVYLPPGLPEERRNEKLQWALAAQKRERADDVPLSGP